MGRRGLPDRWINYRAVGEKIAGTSFISFKVPLKESMVRNLPQNERFTTQVLMDSVPNIGLVIDLTNTDRYYSPQDFLGQGIRYEKIFCRGHEIPSKSVVDKFFSIVDKFREYLQSSEHQGDEQLIGVHCTHGLNRTGYLVCRYMIRRLGFSPEDAISAFEKARGYPMEREEYLKSLRDNENDSETAVSDGDMQNHDDVHSSGNNQDSTSAHGEDAGNFPSCQNKWTDGVPSHAWDKRTDDYRNNDAHSSRYNQDSTSLHGEETGNLPGCQSSWTDGGAPSYGWEKRTDGYGNFLPDRDRQRFWSFPRNYSQCTRSNFRSWPSKINVSHFNNYGNFSRNTRVAGHPYYWERGASFDPKERGSDSNLSVSSRFSRQDSEDSVFRRRQFNSEGRPSSFPGESTQSTPRKHRHTTDWRDYDHSV